MGADRYDAGQAQIAGRDWRQSFDMTDPSFGDNFDAICDDLVQHCPVARTVEGEWVVSSHAGVTQVMLNADIFASGQGIRGINYWPKPEEMLRPNEMDPPEHGWLRHSWDPYFTNAAVAQYEPAVRAIIHGLIDEFVAAGEVELVAQFADPLSCRTFCQAMAHMPVGDMPFIQKSFQAALTGRSVEERSAHFHQVHEYVAAFLADRRAGDPQNDIVDTILAFEYPDGRPCADVERASFLMQITAAGLVTTGAIISGAIYHLAANPPDRERLLADPALLPGAIEEFLRVFVAAPMVGRRVTEDTEIADTKISQGDFVWYNIGGANRDPSAIEDPARVDVTRTPNRHLTFGTGRHRCLGPTFARMNIRVALEAILQRLPDFALAPGFEPHYEAGMVRRMTGLQLTFEPSTPA